MPRKRFTVEQIINHLREGEVFLSFRPLGRRGLPPDWRVGAELLPLPQGVWRSVKVNQARCLKELEQENARLRRAVSNLTLRSFSLSSSQRLIS